MKRNAKNRLQHKLHFCHKNNKDNAAIAEKLDGITAALCNTDHKLWDQTQLFFGVRCKAAVHLWKIYCSFPNVAAHGDVLCMFLTRRFQLILSVTRQYVAVHVKTTTKKQQFSQFKMSDSLGGAAPLLLSERIHRLGPVDPSMSGSELNP